MRAAGSIVPLLCLLMPREGEARRAKPPPPPDAWTWSVKASRTVTSRATGAAAAGMPPGLAEPYSDTVSWTAVAGIDQIYPDGSISELMRVHAPGSPMDGRVFGLRRFDDGEVLRVERLDALSDTGLAAWDPILVGISPAQPEEVTVRSPGRRALQWTARVGTARFLRSNCPATWTVVEDDGQSVEGWLGRPVQHVRYSARCGMNGRSDVPGGGPVPMRGQGTMEGDVWWDAETRQVLRHSFRLERVVESRWVTSGGGVALTQDQSFEVQVDWKPAEAVPEPARPLLTSAVMAALPSLGEAWGRCTADPGPKEVVLVADAGGKLRVVSVETPTDPTGVVPVATAQPGMGAPPDAPESEVVTSDLSCWQRAAQAVTLPPHDDVGETFAFVMPRNGDGYGAPGVMDRERSAPDALFLVTPPELQAATAAWLGVR